MINQRDRKFWLPASVFMILLIAVLAMLFVNGAEEDKEGVAKIDGIAVTHHELDREMERCRASVINRIVKEHGITDMAGFWETTYSGQTALEILRQKALDTLVFFKVQERLLRERNLWAYNDYSELINDLAETNEVRAKAAKEGATIYGPINYSERSFFDYQFSNAVIRLKEKLVQEGELPVDEHRLSAHFDTWKGTVYQQGEQLEDVRHQVRDAYIEKMYTIYIAEKAAKADIALNKE